MKWLNIFFLLVLPSMLFSQAEVGELRTSLSKVKEDSDYASDLYHRLKGEVNKNALKNGYLGVIEAMMAEHSYNPIKKLTLFNAGKDRLETAIKEDTKSVELRYLRLGMQLNVPSFLGYNNEKDMDRKHIIANLVNQKVELGELYYTIIRFLLDANICSAAEKSVLTQLKQQ